MTKCIEKDCDREVLVRGLCNKHYSHYRYRVTDKREITWAFLELLGKALPITRIRPRSKK